MSINEAYPRDKTVTIKNYVKGDPRSREAVEKHVSDTNNLVNAHIIKDLDGSDTLLLWFKEKVTQEKGSE